MEIKFTKVNYQKFHNISFEIPENEITGIYRTNSDSILDLLMGKVNYDGTINFGEKILSNKNKLSLIKKISIVENTFQNKYSKTTIEEYMTYMFEYYKFDIKDPRKKIIDSLKIVDLKDNYLTRNITTLSTSEKKLLQIAISLINNPKIIILEEPFTNLDTKTEKKIFRLLTQLNEKYKICIIITSKDSEILYKYTKHLIIFKNNKVLKEGNSKEIYENVKFLLKEDIEIPDIVLFTYKAKTEKKVNIDYHRDIRDLIKDIYKHV